MEKFRLTSMVDFVLEQKSKSKNSAWVNMNYELICNYANFLKQPLKLEMFVRCYDDGRVMNQPKEDDFSNPKDYNEYAYKFYKALDKVLFNDCDIVDSKEYYLVTKSGKILWATWNKSKTIESLIKHDLTLTQSAKNIIGI